MTWRPKYTVPCIPGAGHRDGSPGAKRWVDRDGGINEPQPDSAECLGDATMRLRTSVPVVLAVVLAVFSLLAQDSRASGRPFRFTECHALQVEVRNVPDFMEESKEEMDNAAEKRLEQAGLLAEDPNDDFYLRFRVIELPQMDSRYLRYMIHGTVFHRMDDHEFGSGYVVLWDTVGFEGYSNPSEAVRGVVSLIEVVTDAFIADYQQDNASCGSSSSWW